MSCENTVVLFKRAGSGVRRRELRAFALELCAKVAEGRAFTCLFTDDLELEKLNRAFLGKDYAADVLSFPSGGGDSLGDIAISVDRAREQANTLGHSADDELRILMLHGVLHLLGHDHERDRGAMARLEARRRREFGLPPGLIERSREAKAR
jgi:probable rRNA maturation factor